MNEQKLKEEIAFLRQLLGLSITLLITISAGSFALYLKGNPALEEIIISIVGFSFICILIILTIWLVNRIFKRINQIE